MKKEVSLNLVIHGRLSPSLSVYEIRKVVRRTLESLGLESAVLGVAILSEKFMTEKNQIYRRKVGPTDVLSFAYSKSKKLKILSGDVLICPAYAAKQAKREDVPLNQALRRLLIHGLLHLAGFNHTKQADAKHMLALQERILKTV